MSASGRNQTHLALTTNSGQLEMRYAPVLASLVLVACSSSAELAQVQTAWENKLNAAVPVGSSVVDAEKWLESQGAKPYSGRAVSDKNDPLYAVATIKAREWYCDNWVVLVTIRPTADGRVQRYDLQNSGLCL